MRAGCWYFEKLVTCSHEAPSASYTLTMSWADSSSTRRAHSSAVTSRMGNTSAFSFAGW